MNRILELMQITFVGPRPSETAAGKAGEADNAFALSMQPNAARGRRSRSKPEGNWHTLLAPVLLTACVACGCARTVAPEEFLYAYRRGASPTYTREGYKVRYTGTDGGYHYLEVRHDTLGKGVGPLLLHGTFRDQTLRCPTAQLPQDFPDDFEVLHKWTTIDEQSAMEPPSRTRQYIRHYLAGATKRPDDWDR